VTFAFSKHLSSLRLLPLPETPTQDLPTRVPGYQSVLPHIMPMAQGTKPKVTTQGPLSITPKLALATSITKCLTLSNSHRIQHLLIIQVNLTRSPSGVSSANIIPTLIFLALFNFQNSNITHLIMADPDQCKALINAL
jgi:hypothetical protein